MLSTPAAIVAPAYVDNAGRATGAPWDGDDPMVKDAETVKRMRIAGRIAALALDEVGRHVAPGVTTDELDRIGHQFLVDAGAFPSTLGYKGFPKSSPASRPSRSGCCPSGPARR